MFSEECLNRKINQIADRYAAFTGQSNSWKQMASISQYNELRKQAIMEIKEGFGPTETSPESLRQPQSPTYEKPVPTVSVKSEPQTVKKEVVVKTPPPLPDKPEEASKTIDFSDLVTGRDKEKVKSEEQDILALYDALEREGM